MLFILSWSFCRGGEFFYRIVSKRNCTDRAAAMITKTILEIVEVLPLYRLG